MTQPKTSPKHRRYNRERMARIVASRRQSGQCLRCGAPAAERVILHPDGREAERRRMTECVGCLMARRR